MFERRVRLAGGEHAGLLGVDLKSSVSITGLVRQGRAR